MKNIHIIPTEKPSRLHLKSDGFYLTKEENSFIPYSYPQDIYITSDEEIKKVKQHKGKWYLEKGKILNWFPNYLTDLSECKLVILTTDQDLIKDGVQAIDDEFLEWFVKNLTCERVEVKKKYSDFTVDPFVGYEIIIPKEEPKPFLDDSAFSLPDFNLSKNVFDKMSSLDNVKKTPKTETLKEAVDRLCYADQSMFIMGVNWQKERSFSKEEVLNIANWAFHFYKRNDLSDSELEEEFEKLLNETLTKK
jgi:hypothetical protein